jgi:hypothetical protein
MPNPTGKGISMFNSRSPQLESNYFLCFLIKNLRVIDIIKLTIAPIEANKTVLKTSSECKFGKMLKNVPLAVPINVGLLDCIFMIVNCGNLTHC